MAPVGCMSTLQKRVSFSDVEAAFAATIYCLRKFHPIVAVSPQIEVRSPVKGLDAVAKLQKSGARLASLIAELNSYPVVISYSPAVATKLATALSLLDGELDEA